MSSESVEGSRIPTRANIGCGATPTAGWINIDGSPSVRYAKWQSLLGILRVIGLASERNVTFAEFARSAGIRYGDVCRRLPLADESCDVIYSCHMLEHIVRHRVGHALREMKRVLKPGGVIRIAVPDLRRMSLQYLEANDADEFLAKSLLSEFWNELDSFSGRLRSVLLGNPGAHKWMYDGDSLVRLLTDHGFSDCRVQPSGQTMITDPGNLDLAERSPESVFVEARVPG